MTDRVVLSEPQRIALRVLAASTRPWQEASRSARTNTLDSLVRLGLVETRTIYPLRFEYRISAEGRAVCEDSD